jgi:hypothetical protein
MKDGVIKSTDLKMLAERATQRDDAHPLGKMVKKPGPGPRHQDDHGSIASTRPSEAPT